MKTMRLENARRIAPRHVKATSALLTRLALGSVFIQSGFAKITHHAMTVIFFANLGFGKATPLVSIAIPWIEFISGIALIGGLLSRLASFVLIADMTVAIVVANPEVAADIFKLLRFYDFLYILLLMGLISYGPGLFSFEGLIARLVSSSRQRRSESIPEATRPIEG
jgi:uncharacterized membrane protein YphA (DoxX/SURF4 family)